MGEVVPVEPDDIAQAQRDLGKQLAARRRGAGLTQAAFAPRVGYSRSTIANAEVGREYPPRRFWELCDQALESGAQLLATYEAVDALKKRAKRQAADQRDLALDQRIAQWQATHDPAESHAGTITPALAVVGTEATGPALDLLAATASEVRRHARFAEISDVGPGELEQLRADVIRLARGSMTKAPLAAFAELKQIQARLFEVLSVRVRPREKAELYRLAGATAGLMANASLDLGQLAASDALARAAWSYGNIIGDHSLMGWARGTQALTAMWDQRYGDAVSHADHGLEYLGHGSGAVRLHAIRARALAHAGDLRSARRALNRSRSTEGNSSHADDIHEGFGGEFSFSQAKRCYYDAVTLVDLGDADGAEAAAVDAIKQYEAANAAERSYGCEALARIQLASARLLQNELDGAGSALEAVLSLPRQYRVSSLAHYLGDCQALLDRREYRGSHEAHQLGEHIAAFRQSIWDTRA